MEIKRLVSKYIYRIEPKLEGGFIARTSDPNVVPLEAATREELQQKIQSTVLAGLSMDFPGLKLPPQSGELKFSFHVEKHPDGTFDIHSSDPNVAPISAANHDEVESHFAEKLISFVGKHVLQDAPESLRAQLASGDIKVFINKTSGFTVTTKEGTTSSGTDSRNSGPITSNLPATFGGSSTPIDSSPITPVNDSGGKFLRILFALAILGAVIFFLLRHR